MTSLRILHMQFLEFFLTNLLIQTTVVFIQQIFQIIESYYYLNHVLGMVLILLYSENSKK